MNPYHFIFESYDLVINPYHLFHKPHHLFLVVEGCFFTVPSIFFCSRFINSFATLLAFIPKMEPPPRKCVCMIFSESVATSYELSCGTSYEVNDSIFNQYQLVMNQLFNF